MILFLSGGERWNGSSTSSHPRFQFPHPINPEITIRTSQHHKPWLERLCVRRWVALLSWIALASLSVALVSLGLLNVTLRTADRLARSVSALVPVLSGVLGLWNWIAIALIFVWFQPLLLRLNAWRSIAWVSTFAFAFTASLFLYANGGDSLASFLVLAVGLMAALPGIALIGWRSRPWMILIAAALFSATFWYTASSDYFTFHKALGNEVFIAVLAANIPYAAVLLYGTELKAKPRVDNRKS